MVKKVGGISIAPSMRVIFMIPTLLEMVMIIVIIRVVEVNGRKDVAILLFMIQESA